MKVFLFGFMGCGKTTFGEKLATFLGIQFIDLDHYIEDREKRTIKHIFETDGEDKFREIERDALAEVISQEKFVLATGGGTPCYFENLELMKKNGVTVFLRLETRKLVTRLMNAKIHRPLIWGKSEKELTEFVKTTLKKRKVYYKKSHLKVDASDPVIENISKKIERKYKKIGGI